MYDTEEEAAQAWDKVAFVYRGAEAKLNFPHLVSGAAAASEGETLMSVSEQGHL